MSRVAVSVAGASGYVGGEFMRLLLAHPQVELRQATAEQHAGQPIGRIHPNLRRRTAVRFCTVEELRPCDLLFLCLPHGETMRRIDRFLALAPRLVDLSADFRLRSAGAYRAWYGSEHARPDLLTRFVYGIPELHRAEMRAATLVSSAGCNATAVILALYPLFKNDLVDPERTVAEVKVGSSEGGNSPSTASHHPERSHCVRCYKPSGHRHTAEIVQELSLRRPMTLHLTATAVDLVRGVQATCHAFLRRAVTDQEIWNLYRREYGAEPFVRIVKEREGPYRYPEPKLLFGTNYCDIGFELDPRSDRIVVVSALDNLMKGAAGQAVQAMNLMFGFPETEALDFAGLHPI